MYNRLLRHLHHNDILFEEKFVFRKNLNQTATYELFNEILSALNDKLIVGGIFL